MYVDVENVVKSYGEGAARATVLNGVTLSIAEGEICVMLGPSGSGKSTLLNVIGGLDAVDSGRICVAGKVVTDLDVAALSDYRRDYLGFVFQFYNLIPNLTVRENIEVCRYLSNEPLDTGELIELLGLADHARKFPAQLSGGQQQRCAIARALVKGPRLLLCDEPTGALDSVTAREILMLLERVNETLGTTLVVVTHNNAVSLMAHQTVRVRDGRIAECIRSDRRIPAAEIEW